jgi:HTH-type transcriptional regulator/antitoxin HipB
MVINSMRDVAATVRGRRKDMGLSQAELAARAGVSREWINAFETGKPSVEFALVLRLLGPLGLRLDLAPEGEVESAAKRPVDLDSLLDDYRRRD